MKTLIALLLCSLCAHAAQTNQLQRWKPTDAQPTNAALRELAVSFNKPGIRIHPTANGGMIFKLGKVTTTAQLQAQDARGWITTLTNDAGVFVIILPKGSSYMLRLMPAAGKTSVPGISASQWQDALAAIELFISKTKADVK